MVVRVVEHLVAIGLVLIVVALLVLGLLYRLPDPISGSDLKWSPGALQGDCAFARPTCTDRVGQQDTICSIQPSCSIQPPLPSTRSNVCVKKAPRSTSSPDHRHGASVHHPGAHKAVVRIFSRRILPTSGEVSMDRSGSEMNHSLSRDCV